MALSPCTEFSSEDQALMLQLARQAIGDQLSGSRAKPFMCDRDELGVRRGVFVTLLLEGNLRGCIGTLEADQPLFESVPDSARGAAFRDPRFPTISQTEFSELTIEISVLTLPQALPVTGREDLLRQLRPQIDGLVIEEERYRATFLPQVWEQLAQPEEFLSHLLRKAGLPGDYWSERLRCSRYQCIKFSEADQPPA